MFVPKMVSRDKDKLEILEETLMQHKDNLVMVMQDWLAFLVLLVHKVNYKQLVVVLKSRVFVVLYQVNLLIHYFKQIVMEIEEFQNKVRT